MPNQSDTTYNGWTNYETWLVNLWIDNEYDINMWQDRAREINDVYYLADEIKQFYEDNNPIDGNGLYCDLLSSAMQQVDWNLIAAHIIESSNE